MQYLLSGDFLESCDCTVICPCWVNDDPVGGHCTGFILWQLDKESYITGGGIETKPGDLSGCKVVSVSTHSGKRRQGGSTTSVLYVDPGGSKDADKLVDVLGEAFAGKAGGILEELAQVSGTVVENAGQTSPRISRSRPANSSHGSFV